MRKLTMFGIGGALAAAAIGGGLGVALAHSPGGGHHSGMTNGQSGMHMSMDPAAMDQHMREVMGEAAYAAMRGAMDSMGSGAYDEMLDRMQAGCGDMSSMMAGESSAMPGHASHHQ